MIVLKEADLLSVYNEFLGLAKLQPEGRLKERILKPIEIKRDFRWVDGIEYCDSKDREHLLNVIELNETKPQDGQPKTTRFMWVSDLEINKGNIREVAGERREGSLENRESRL